MVVISSPLPLAAAAVVAASAIAVLPSTQSLSIKTSSQIPHRTAPKSLSSLSSTRGYQSSNPERGSSRRKKGRGRQQLHQPLRAYTVADNNNNKPSWVSFLTRPMRRQVTMNTPFAELSQFGRMEMEGTFTDWAGGY